jgi:branched-chain amino acid transport system permease protein
MSARAIAVGSLVTALVLLPAVTAALAEPFYVTLATRILVFALAAAGLNLVLGYGGLVSFGHALYIGLGAYAVGILAFHGVTNGWAHLATAVGLSAAIALVTGIVCLRTSGMAFIMITLAFAQMVYFLGVSLKQYGGDDGLQIPARSDFAPL